MGTAEWTVEHELNSQEKGWVGPSSHWKYLAFFLSDIGRLCHKVINWLRPFRVKLGSHGGTSLNFLYGRTVPTVGKVLHTYRIFSTSSPMPPLASTCNPPSIPSMMFSPPSPVFWTFSITRSGYIIHGIQSKMKIWGPLFKK